MAVGARGAESGFRFRAWPLARCFLELERELERLPPRMERPILGTAIHRDEIRQRLTAYLLEPLLAAQREGMVQILGAEPPFRGTRNPTPEQEREWIELLRSLGKFWERTLETMKR